MIVKSTPFHPEALAGAHVSFRLMWDGVGTKSKKYKELVTKYEKEARKLYGLTGKAPCGCSGRIG